jgi:squalene-associated FAD-dependent desaturase
MTGKSPGARGARNGKVFVVGAGLAGLCAAVILAKRGAAVTLIEAAGQAGGRCRSYFDAAIDGVIDNGNHFVLSGNRAVMDYVRAIGAEHALVKLDEVGVSFVDFRDGARWRIAPNDGIVPFWLFDRNRRVPGTKLRDYLALIKLLAASPGKRIADVLACKGVLWDRLLRPFFLGALKTQPEEASALLAGAIVRGTFARGGRAYRVRIAHPTLGAAFVDPAVLFLQSMGASVKMGTRVRGLAFDGHYAMALDTAESSLPVAPGDVVVLAVPPWSATDLIAGLTVPNAFRAIVNAHFKIAGPSGAPPMLGVIGGTAEWIFPFKDRISVTISGADAIVDQDREDLAIRIWADVSKALGLKVPMPAWQVVKEKRATFAATPEQDARRPAARTQWRNLFLAGDWTQNGLPATIEGALRSGETAAALALKHLSL